MANCQLAACLVNKNAPHRLNDESWYLQQVCESIGLSLASLEGVQLDLRFVDASNLNQSYIVGFAMESGYDVNRCSLTPFADHDGGKGMVLKVMS